MFCQYQYYRKHKHIWGLQAVVDHSEEKYQCEKMSDCPYTGTTVIEKRPWGDFPAGKEPAAQEMKENVELAGKEEDRETEDSNTSQALSKLQSEVRELRKKLKLMEEEKEKALQEAREAGREQSWWRRMRRRLAQLPGLRRTRS